MAQSKKRDDLNLEVTALKKDSNFYHRNLLVRGLPKLPVATPDTSFIIGMIW